MRKLYFGDTLFLIKLALLFLIATGTVMLITYYLSSLYNWDLPPQTPPIPTLKADYVILNDPLSEAACNRFSRNIGEMTPVNRNGYLHCMTNEGRLFPVFGNAPPSTP